MIRLYVSTDYVGHFLNLYGIHYPSKALTSDLNRLRAEPIQEYPDLAALEMVTVAEVLANIHRRVVALLREHNLIDCIVQSIRGAFDQYHISDPHVTEREANEIFALHLLGSHGKVEKDRVVLVDLLTGFGLFLVPRFPNFGQYGFYPEHLIIDPATEVDPRMAQCHLCDNLLMAQRRYLVFAEKKRDALENLFLTSFNKEAELRAVAHANEKRLLADSDAGEGDFLLLCIAGGFAGIRSVRRDNPDVPMIGNHRLLAASAVRQGIGKRIISSIFPSDLWDRFEVPVQHFLLSAAEKSAATSVSIRYPNVPDRESVEELLNAAEETEHISAVENSSRECFAFEYENPPHRLILEQLGLFAAVNQRVRKHSIRYRHRDWLWDWTTAIAEYHAAFFTDNIEASLALQDVLDLYPLHKRVLGLVEYIILPKLKDRKLYGNASQLWTDGFLKTDSGPLNHLKRPSLSFLATLETEGNWLIIAKNVKAQGNHLDLAYLLDKLVSRIKKAKESIGLSVTLAPNNPSEHAKELAKLANKKNDQAACLTFYLGKVALMFRNAIEHGTDEVFQDQLRIDCATAWTQTRKKYSERDSVSIVDWNLDAAEKLVWRHKTSLPDSVPSPANGLILSPQSLHRCLSLLSLVLHAGFSHLGI